MVRQPLRLLYARWLICACARQRNALYRYFLGAGGNATLVLRDSMSPAAKFIEQLLALHGVPFLCTTLGPVLGSYIRNPHSLEVPSRPPPPARHRSSRS